MGFLPRFTVVATLLVIRSTSSFVNAEKPSCIEIESGKALVRYANTSDVFVMVNKEDSTDKKEWNDFCTYYKDTSSQKLKGLKVGYVHGDKHKNIAKKLGVEDSSDWPSFVIVKKGTKGKELPKKAIKFEGEEKGAGQLADFLIEHTDSRLGHYVYSIHPFDDLAARMVGVEDDDKYADLKRKMYAYFAMILRKFMYLRAKEDMKVALDMYVKTFQKILEKGTDYPETQTTRLENLMNDEGSQMSKFKKEEMSQRMHIYSKFTSPMELTYEDHKTFFILLGSQVLLFLLFLGIVGDALLGGRDAEVDTKENQAEVKGSDASEEVDDKKEE